MTCTDEKEKNVKKALIAILFLVGLVVLVSRPFSVVDLCYPPAAVMTTEMVYDVATDTYIQAVPRGTFCITPGGQAGEIFTRYQWIAR